jgi:type III secretion protein L
VSKKLFSFILGGDIHLTPESKIIPAEVISTSLDITQMLEKAKQDAAEYRKQVEEECIVLKEQAQELGFEEGLKQWAEKLQELETQIDNVRGEMSEVLVPVALKAAKKVVGREIELDPKAVLDIIRANLKAVTTHTNITIYVSKKDLDLVEKERDNLKNLFDKVETFTIRERSDIEQGGCVIETEGGIINARLDNVWQTLEKAFESLLQSKGKAK